MRRDVSVPGTLSALPDPWLRAGLVRGVFEQFAIRRFGSSKCQPGQFSYLDRFLIGILSVYWSGRILFSARGRLIRVLIVPASLCAILFPAFWLLGCGW
jgi:hypothetical protein